jgi:DNA sulfur modification protein DndD
MIFEEIVIHNFGAYRGRHLVNLEVTAEKPVVLIGALNGSGKTTLLDAMQLALYGKGAHCSGRDRMGYPDYLESMMNRDAENGHQAGVEFAFRARTGGHDSKIRVHRTWEKRGAAVRENLDIYRDGTLDTVASERWTEFVEDLMPLQIADLFFFDGEKIEGLADPVRSSSLLRVGIHSLLGLDLVDSLIKSLQVLERKKKTSGLAEVDRQKLDALEVERNQVQFSIEVLSQKRAAQQVILDNLKKEEIVANDFFRRVGGDLYLRKQQLDEESARLLSQENDLNNELLESAASGLPLLLASEVIEEVLKKADQADRARNHQLLKSEASKRDAEILAFLGRIKTDKKVLSKVEEFLCGDLNSRYSVEVTDFLVPEGVKAQFGALNLSYVVEAARKQLDLMKEVRERLINLDKNMAAMPSEEVVARAQSEIDRCRSEYARASAVATLQDEEIEEARKKLARLQRQIELEASDLGQTLVQSEKTVRVMTHASKARATLAKFQERLLRENLQHLEKTILDCFRTLARKNKLVTGIAIDPLSFQLSILQDGGRVVPAHRFSAGERQLLAVATLWALARASGRHLPAVIDTPLSRLDSKHRGTLVKDYFPKASHQVILLSTDEEVVGRYYSMLKPYLAREYLIEHDESEKTSRVVSGYFHDQVAREAA